MGFYIGFASQHFDLRPMVHNHPSSLANPQVISTYLDEELTASRMVGPLTSPYRNLAIAAL